MTHLPIIRSTFLLFDSAMQHDAKISTKSPGFMVSSSNRYPESSLKAFSAEKHVDRKRSREMSKVKLFVRTCKKSASSDHLFQLPETTYAPPTHGHMTEVTWRKRNGNWPLQLRNVRFWEVVLAKAASVKSQLNQEVMADRKTADWARICFINIISFVI